MTILITGANGFVGSNLSAALPDAIQWDYEHDLLDGGNLHLPDSVDTVIHLAANADVRDGWADPQRDLLQNTVATSNLLEVMRRQHVRRLLFASSNAVYGDAPPPCKETDTGQATTLYGASKLACEALIGAYAAAGHISATILRLTPMLGPYYKHGLVADFVTKLQKEPHLEVLGGGSIPRTRMHVADGIRAFVHRLDVDPGYEVFNVASDEVVTSLEVAQIVAKRLGIKATITTTPESWVGDHPIQLDCERLRRTGWAPEYTLREAVEATVDWLIR